MFHEYEDVPHCILIFTEGYVVPIVACKIMLRGANLIFFLEGRSRLMVEEKELFWSQDTMNSKTFVKVLLVRLMVAT